MQTQSISLTANVKEVVITPPLRFFKLLQTTGSVDVHLFTDANGSGEVEIAESVAEGFSEFAQDDSERIRRIEIISTTTQTVTIGMSVRTVRDDVLKGNVSIDPYGSVNGIAPVSFTAAGQNKTIAANAARNVLDLLADSANTGLVYVGTTDGTKGIPLSAGQSYSLQTAAAVELWGTANGDSLHIVEVE